jgi:hypothetical protein
MVTLVELGSTIIESKGNKEMKLNKRKTKGGCISHLEKVEREGKRVAQLSVSDSRKKIKFISEQMEINHICLCT